MYGGKQVEGTWLRRTNKKLDELLEKANILQLKRDKDEMDGLCYEDDSKNAAKRK